MRRTPSRPPNRSKIVVVSCRSPAMTSLLSLAPGAAQGYPPVDRYHLAGDVLGLRAAQERCQVADILGGLFALEGNAALHHLQEDVAGVGVGHGRHALLHPAGQRLPRAGPEEARADG